MAMATMGISSADRGAGQRRRQAVRRRPGWHPPPRTPLAHPLTGVSILKNRDHSLPQLRAPINPDDTTLGLKKLEDRNKVEHVLARQDREPPGRRFQWVMTALLNQGSPDEREIGRPEEHQKLPMVSAR